jgi:hypothetical protein
MILFKMLSVGFVDTINGCVSTGKEVRGKYGKKSAVNSP